MTAGTRRALLGVVLASVAGIGIELILTRHWTKPTQLIAWAALALVAAAAVAALRPLDDSTLRVVRAGLALTVLAGVVGAVLHAHGNFEAGPLDGVYGDRWDSMGSTEQWWLAIRQQVGPSPVIVPFALAQLALLVAVALPPRRPIDAEDREPR